MQECMTVMAYGKKCMTEYFPDCYVRRNSWMLWHMSRNSWLLWHMTRSAWL
jgi:hypothetical protein